jgi:hypothetical protein
MIGIGGEGHWLYDKISPVCGSLFLNAVASKFIAGR